MDIFPLRCDRCFATKPLLMSPSNTAEWPARGGPGPHQLAKPNETNKDFLRENEPVQNMEEQPARN